MGGQSGPVAATMSAVDTSKGSGRNGSQSHSSFNRSLAKKHNSLAAKKTITVLAGHQDEPNRGAGADRSPMSPKSQTTKPTGERKPTGQSTAESRNLNKQSQEWKRLSKARFSGANDASQFTGVGEFQRNPVMGPVAEEDMSQLEEGLKSKMSPYDAHAFLEKHGGHDSDYHALSSEHQGAFAAKAHEVGYRKGASAPGSTGRMFHSALKRHAHRMMSYRIPHSESHPPAHERASSALYTLEGIEETGIILAETGELIEIKNEEPHHLEPHHHEALKRYANKHGRNWKSKLNRDWETGETHGEDTALIRQVRNRIGPSGLLKLKLHEGERSEYTANQHLTSSSKSNRKPGHYLMKHGSPMHAEPHKSSSEALSAYKALPDAKGVSIHHVKESGDVVPGAVKTLDELSKTTLKSYVNKSVVKEAILEPNSSGQGHDPEHVVHPLHHTITKHGYKYSHSTPIHRVDGSVYISHTYKQGEHHVSTHSDPHYTGSQIWHTQTRTSSGRHHSGMGVPELEAHLKSKARRHNMTLKEAEEKKKPTHIAQAGWGYDTHDGNFRRLAKDTKVHLAHKEYAKPHHVIGYDAETGERMHLDNRSLKPIDENNIYEAAQMKIKPEHYEKMRAAVHGVLDNHPDSVENYTKHGLSPKRHRWDALHASKIMNEPQSDGHSFIHHIYKYANDSHVDTALKHIVASHKSSVKENNVMAIGNGDPALLTDPNVNYAREMEHLQQARKEAIKDMLRRSYLHKEDRTLPIPAGDLVDDGLPPSEIELLDVGVSPRKKLERRYRMAQLPKKVGPGGMDERVRDK